MATVTSGTSASFIVAAGDQLFVTTTGSAVVESLVAPAGNAAIRQVVTGQTVILGPFSSDATFKVTATTGETRYANDVRYASDGTAIGNDGPFDGDGRADGSQWNAGGVVYVKRGGQYQAPTSAQATEFRRAFSVAPREPKGCAQSISMLGQAGAATAGTFTFTDSLYVDGDFFAARFCYSNYGATPATIAVAKCAATAALESNGVGLTYSNITFDGVATARRDTSYAGVAGATTTIAMPARISGSGSNNVPSRTWSDWVPLASIPCTDPGFEEFRALQHRVYISTSGATLQQTGSQASNWGDYNTNSRRKHFGQLTSGDQVTTISSITPIYNWQWMPCTEIQVLLRKPVWNHGVFGDSISKGQGSFNDSNGLWGWAHRAVQGLTDMGGGIHSLVSAAVSGQGKAATWNIMMQSLQSGGLDTATLFPWSPNDGQTTVGDFAWQIRSFVAECRKYGTTPILCTSLPAAQITDPTWDAVRKSVNADIRAMVAHGAIVCDFDAAVSDGAAVARFLPGLSGDNVHPSASGHAVMAEVYKAAVLAATSTTVSA